MTAVAGGDRRPATPGTTRGAVGGGRAGGAGGEGVRVGLDSRLARRSSRRLPRLPTPRRMPLAAAGAGADGGALCPSPRRRLDLIEPMDANQRRRRPYVWQLWQPFGSRPNARSRPDHGIVGLVGPRGHHALALAPPGPSTAPGTLGASLPLCHPTDRSTVVPVCRLPFACACACIYVHGLAVGHVPLPQLPRSIAPSSLESATSARAQHSPTFDLVVG